jgi:hypothetical protein
MREGCWLVRGGVSTGYEVVKEFRGSGVGVATDA